MPVNKDRLKDAPAAGISTVEELDDLLLGICQIDAELKGIQARAEDRIAKLRGQVAQEARPLQLRREELIRAGCKFVEDNPGALLKGKAKTRKLTHGKAGTRKKQGRLAPLGASKEENARLKDEAIAWLEARHPDAVKVVKSVDLAALRKLGAEVWKKVRYGLKGAKEEPFLEPDKKTVEDIFKNAARGA